MFHVYRNPGMKADFPDWIRRNWPSGKDFEATRDLLDDLGLNTVCSSAQCPNIAECWQHNRATFLILGPVCTRNCPFCAVKSGRPHTVDPQEPHRIAEGVSRLGLDHVVLTSVTRDDMPDGGAAHFAATIDATRSRNPETIIEVLIPDLQGRAEPINTILDAQPDVFGHNIETVPRLYPEVRDPRADYRRSLEVLDTANTHLPRPVVKSAIMVGHGETPDDVRIALNDLNAVGCDAVFIGQYLQPAPNLRNVVEFLSPERFQEYSCMAKAIGIPQVVAGPFVRSSYWPQAIPLGASQCVTK